MRDSLATQDFLSLVDGEAENALIQRCAGVLERLGMLDQCYFDRYRVRGTRGLALHFHPSVDPRAVLKEIGPAEGGPGMAFMPFIDDPKAALADVFGGLDSLATYQRFSFSSAPLLWKWSLDGRADPAKRLPLALHVLLDYMYRMRPRLESRQTEAYPALFISFRSHFEGFAAGVDDRQAVEAAFDKRYLSVQPWLQSVVSQYECNPQGASQAPALASWQSLVDQYFDLILASVNQETLVTGLQAPLRGGKNLLASSFHEKVVSNKEYTRHAMRQPLFQTNRILLGLVYLSLFRVGLPLIERYFLCYALSRYIEERHGVSPEDAFDASVARSARERRWSWLSPKR